MIEHLQGLPVQLEHTSFRLTDDEVNVIINDIKSDSFKYNSGTKSSYLLNDSRLSRVKNFLDKSMNNYVENVVEITNKFVMTQSWATVTKKGEKHHHHQHPNTIFSSVFYVRSEGVKSGNFVFDFQPSRLMERWMFNFSVKNYNPFNSNSWEYVVNTGDLIMFPAWMYHFTRENKSDEDRIIIGANYFVEGVLGKKFKYDKINIQLGDIEDD